MKFDNKTITRKGYVGAEQYLKHGGHPRAITDKFQTEDIVISVRANANSYGLIFLIY